MKVVDALVGLDPAIQKMRVIVDPEDLSAACCNAEILGKIGELRAGTDRRERIGSGRWKAEIEGGRERRREV